MTSVDPDPALHLDAQLCFRLYRGERAVLGTYRELLADLGVTYPQYLVLLVLWEQGESTVSDLGTRLALDSGTLSPLLRRMETAGLLTRSRERPDERVVVVRPTAAGRALRERAGSVPRDLAHRTGLDADDAATLARLLDTLCANLARGPLDPPVAADRTDLTTLDPDDAGTTGAPTDGDPS